MQRFVNTFTKGLDKDTNVNKYSNENYQDAENIRLIVDEENGSGTITNLQGISLEGYFPNEKIVGTTTVNDKIVIFTKVGNTTTSRIYYLSESDLSSPTPLISKKFKFGDHVEVIARYQNSTTTKIWWVDGVNSLRSCNLEETDIGSKNLAYFDVYSNINLPNIYFKEITGGKLKSGSYQYVYSLYSINKTETIFSNSPYIIPITSSPINTSTTLFFKGDSNGTVSNKGISIIILNALTNNPYYTKIRIARLFYSSSDSIPIVDIVYEGELTDNVSFNDVGSSLGTLAFEDVNNIPNIFVATTLETKNNYLFAGNITEDNFDIDIDMRMYQFPPKFTQTIYYETYDKTNGVGVTEVPIDGNYNVSIESNLLNLKNVLEFDSKAGVDNNQYKYHSIERGGSGKYGEFTLGDDTAPNTFQYSIIDSNLANVHPEAANKRIYSWDLPASNPNLYKYVGYQRDEIYRFGIVFTDNKGRTSFVKWIADIRFPEYDLISGTTYGRECEAINMGINFTFNAAFKTYLIANNIVSYQIVRCSRDNDGTVIDAGYIVPLRKAVDTYTREGEISMYIENGVLFFNSFDINDENDSLVLTYLDNSIKYITGALWWEDERKEVISDSEYFEYITPTSNYNLNDLVADRIDIDQSLAKSWVKHRVTSDTAADGVDDGTIIKIIPGRDDRIYNISLRTEINKEINFTATEDIDHILTLEGGKAVSPRIIEHYERITTAKYSLYNKFKWSMKGSCKILKLKDNPSVVNNKYGAYCLRRSVVYPYGGYTHAARTNSKYIACSEQIQITTGTVDVYGGDTFITFFEQLRGFGVKDKDNQYKNVNIVHAALESKMNFAYNDTNRFSYYDTNNPVTETPFEDSYLYYNIKEHKGAYSVKDGQIFEQLEDFYSYNSAYTPSIKKYFFPKPLDFAKESNYPTRVYRSNKKFNSEISDSWSEFKFNNFIDLDNTYGELTKLILHNEQLTAIQPKALGIISVEPREIMPSTQGEALNIATGGILDRYDYLTTKTGSAFQQSILSTMNGLYYYDGINKKICKLSEGIEYISDTKGIQSSIGKANITKFNTLYHPIYKEVWFNYTDTTNKNFTYNEYLQSFISRNEILGEFWFNLRGNIYFLNNALHLDGGIEASIGTIQLLDQNNRSKYKLSYATIGTEEDYSINIGLVSSNSSLTLIINPNNVLVNRFDILELTIDSIEDLPITDLTIDNSYMTSGKIVLNDDNLKRRFRTYRFNQMRGVTEADGAEPRFLDTYLKVKLNFKTTDELIKFYDLITTYEPLKLNAVN